MSGQIWIQTSLHSNGRDLHQTPHCVFLIWGYTVCIYQLEPDQAWPNKQIGPMILIQTFWELKVETTHSVVSDLVYAPQKGYQAHILLTLCLLL